jgi:DNA repair exonuclease SbcCD ATPase subunit
MKFKWIEIKDFMSLKSISIPLDKPGLIGVFGENLDIGGSNGSGKSAIWDALVWAIYGRTIRKSIADTVIRTGVKDTSVIVTFDLGTIKRTREHGKPSKIYFDDKLTTQEDITKLIGLDYKSFMALVVFGPENARFTRSSDAEQKAILDKVLDLEIYEQALIIVKDKKKKLDNLMIEKSGISKATTDNIIKFEEIIEEKHKVLKLHEETNINQHKLLYGINEELNKYQEQLKLVDLLNDEKKRNEEFSNKLKKNDERLMKIDIGLSKLEDNQCYTCGSILENKRLEKIKESLEEEGKNLILSDATDRDVFYDSLQTIKLINERIELNLDVKISNLFIEKNRILAYIYDTASELKTIVEIQSFLDGFKTRKTLLEVEMSVIKQELEDINFWVEAFGNGGIKSYILDSILPFLTNKTNEYLSDLTDNTISVTFTPQKELVSGDLKEKLEVKVINKIGGTNYDLNSSGEKQRVDIAIALALRDLITNRLDKDYGITVFDEVFEHLDSSGCEKVIQLMKKIADNNTIFITSHSLAIQELLESKKIVISKCSGQSECIVTI